MNRNKNKHIVTLIKQYFSISGSSAITPHANGVLCFLPIYPDAGSSFMLFIENNLNTNDVRITDYSSCYENAFHFCDALQEEELKARISQYQDIVEIEEYSDGSWSLSVSFEDNDSDDEINHVLDVFDTIFSITDSFMKGIFDAA